MIAVVLGLLLAAALVGAAMLGLRLRTLKEKDSAFLRS
jgi:hypothetical protein